MSGYREHHFDPNAYQQQGRPMRPFNWVQWTGVAIGCIGMVLTTLQVAGQLGWIPRWLDNSPVFTLLLLGVVLVNARREPSTLAGPEQRARNRRALLITTAVLAAIFGGVLIIQFLGA